MKRKIILIAGMIGIAAIATVGILGLKRRDPHERRKKARR